MRDITKSFPGVKALDSVNLKVEKGTVHALMGENGAGKSTLMKILFGQQPPDSGTIQFNGQEVHFKSVKEAVNAGISMIYQGAFHCGKRIRRPLSENQSGCDRLENHVRFLPEDL